MTRRSYGANLFFQLAVCLPVIEQDNVWQAERQQDEIDD